MQLRRHQIEALEALASIPGPLTITVQARKPVQRPEIEVTFDEQAAFWTFGREAWQATFGGYDLGCTVGTGSTPLAAIVDLLDQTEG